MATVATTPRKRSADTDAAIARNLDARPDTADFRDRMFEPSLVNVPTSVPLSRHLDLNVPILDQGEQGACTAFGLATVAHTLLRTRVSGADQTHVSTRMLYDMARRYDEWPGESYSGSSCRGAMKGWHHHGVCSEAVWPYTAGTAIEPYTEARARDAARHPLGAYYRVNHRDLVAMHAAFAEVGVLFASCAVHAGWNNASKTGRIVWKEQDEDGYHAFAIVGYDNRGFWIQNSWGRQWGRQGFGHLDYDEWLQRGTDVWVARLAVPVRLHHAESVARSNASLARQSLGYSQADLRPHIVSIGNDGVLRDSGRFGTTLQDVRNMVRDDIPRVTKDWPKKRILLYAHGGLVPEQTAIQRIADYREALLAEQIYPLSFVWKSDFWSTLGNILREVGKSRSEGALDRTKDFLLDRFDDTLEPLARAFGGKVLWDEMKENALLATNAVHVDRNGRLQEAGAAALVARLLDDWMRKDPTVELHLVGHSAGSILLAPLVQLLTSNGQITDGPASGLLGIGNKIASVNLWAPAMSVEMFMQTFAPALQSKAIDRACLFTLTDKAENDDHCANIYHKSLLYLVAHAFESQPRSWVNRRFRHGTPLLGMARFIDDTPDGSAAMRRLIDDGRLDWVQSPSSMEPVGSPSAASATTHGGFDDDRAVLQATIARITQRKQETTPVQINRSDAGLNDRRRKLRHALCLGD